MLTLKSPLFSICQLHKPPSKVQKRDEMAKISIVYHKNRIILSLKMTIRLKLTCLAKLALIVGCAIAVEVVAFCRHYIIVLILCLKRFRPGLKDVAINTGSAILTKTKAASPDIYNE